MPRKSLSTPLLAVMVLAAVLTLAIPGFFIVNGLSGHGLNPLGDHHGLPSDVPLPGGATFQAEIDSSNSTGTLKDWYWTVESPNNPSTLQGFYQSNLASNGWTNVQVLASSPALSAVSGCKGNQALLVFLSLSSLTVGGAQGSDPSMITAPSGGSALSIEVGTQPSLQITTRCS